MQWHPNVATQLCLASEEDQTPIIELWDLRFATSPLRTFQNHQRGVLSIAWNPHDSDLLLSCAKDNRILCWNPNTDIPVCNKQFFFFFLNNVFEILNVSLKKFIHRVVN